jgi:hypothetical protein
MGPGNQVVIASKAGPDSRSRGDSAAAIGIVPIIGNTDVARAAF